MIREFADLRVHLRGEAILHLKPLAISFLFLLFSRIFNMTSVVVNQPDHILKSLWHHGT
jgi:hypothetical protein